MDVISVAAVSKHATLSNFVLTIVVLCGFSECMLWFEVCWVLICLSLNLMNIVEYEILFLGVHVWWS